MPMDLGLDQSFEGLFLECPSTVRLASAQVTFFVLVMSFMQKIDMHVRHPVFQIHPLQSHHITTNVTEHCQSKFEVLS